MVESCCGVTEAELDLALGPIETEIIAINADLAVLDAAVSTLQSNVQLHAQTTTWTNAELKAGTGKTLISTPGSGNIAVPISIVLDLTDPGGNPFTNAPDFTIRWNSDPDTNSTYAGSIEFWQAAQDATWIINLISSGVDEKTSVFSNKTVTGIFSAALTGNSDSDKTVSCTIVYYIFDISP
nr:hypothetical protein [Crucivirus sp.]